MSARGSLIAVLLLSSAVAHAQDLAIAKAAARVDAIQWMTDGFNAPDPGGPQPVLPKTTVDRNKLLDEALARAAAEKKLVFWYMPRIEGVQMYRSPLLDDYMKVVAFTDRLLPKLIESRFVPVRMACSKDLQKRTGIKNVDWIEPAIVVMKPDGTIIHRLDGIRTFNADYFRQVLMALLKQQPELAPVPASVVDETKAAEADFSKAATATFDAVAAGFDEGAERIGRALIEKGPNDVMKAHGWFVIAVVKRLSHEIQDAMAALDSAAKLGGEDAELKGYIATERGLVALRTGDLVAAASHLDDASAAAANPRAAEARYLTAQVQILTGKSRQAESTFRDVVNRWPDSSFAAQSATNLLVGRDTTPIGPAFHAFEDPFFPPDAVCKVLASNTTMKRTMAQSDDAVQRAVAFLLRRQGSDGGWTDSRYAYWSTPRILPNAWTAISAIAMSGLLDWREVNPDAIDKALKKGEAFILNEDSLARGHNEECYADAFRLVYLSKRMAAGVSDKKHYDKYHEAMTRIVKDLARQQSEKGFFAHEYSNPFTTGAVAVALDYARQVGIAVPDALFAEAAKALNSVRSDEGAFAYGAGRAPRNGEDSLKNAMARMPVCERALLIAKPGETKALEAAMDNYWKFMPRFERVRLCDYHTDGELAGFFFWHATWGTSEALKGLPADKRAAHEQKLAEQILSIGEFDGSFIDSHEMGKSYGTGMALMTLKNVLQKKP